jgi:predicted nucleotide-binding protein
LARSRRQQALYGEPADPVPSTGLPRLVRPRSEVAAQLRIDRGNQILGSLPSSITELSSSADEEKKWRDFNFDLLRAAFTSDAIAREYRGAIPIDVTKYERIDYDHLQNRIAVQMSKLESVLERLALYPEPGAQSTVAAIAEDRSKVFVVHGRDEGALQAMARFLGTIGLEAIVLREQPDQGYTTIEKFEARASEVGFAVALLTPDDLGGLVAASEQAARARQNVIFELGYFVGSLGRGRVCLLRKGDVEIPSDLFGVIYTDFDHPAEGWKVKLARELKAAGFKFAADKVLA